VTVFVGTSGWQYASWRGALYPPRLPQRQWLAAYAEAFATVEVNNTFYRLPEASTFDAWRAGTPQDFVFVVKMSRFLTHVKRLREARPAIERFMERARHLEGKLGPLLLQLPPTLHADVQGLTETLDAMPARQRVAIEFRHDSWFTPEVQSLLEQRGVALCLADRGSKPVTPLWRTAGWGYLRMHEGRAHPHPRYGRAALESWADCIAELWPRSADVYVFFNNDSNACAPGDASRFATAMTRRGYHPSRVPLPVEPRVERYAA
jgi:uncharacterized protein YecE (DUF72 family)